MDIGHGFPRINLHKVQKTLDANKQCTPSSLIETACSVTKDGKQINSTISNGVVTVVDESLDEGDTVDLWLYCFRSSEGGGICEQLLSPADEAQMQAYLDAQ